MTGIVQSYFQAMPPSSPNIGDVWFDTDDSCKAFVWNGKAWMLMANSDSLEEKNKWPLNGQGFILSGTFERGQSRKSQTTTHGRGPQLG